MLNHKNVNDGDTFIVGAVDKKIYAPDDGKAPSIGVELRVVEGPMTGETIFKYGSLHDNAQKYTVEMLRALGWNSDDIVACDGLGTVKALARAKLGVDDKGRARVEWQIFPFKSPKATLSTDAESTFRAQFRALAKSVPAVQVTEHNKLEALPPARLVEDNSSEGTSSSGTPF